MTTLGWLATTTASVSNRVAAVGTIAFCVIYGFFSGAFLSLLPSCVAHLTLPAAVNDGHGKAKDQDKAEPMGGGGGGHSRLGARMGMFVFFGGLANLAGNPVAGKLVDVDDDASYMAARVWSAVCVATGACVLLGVLRFRGKVF